MVLLVKLLNYNEQAGEDARKTLPTISVLEIETANYRNLEVITFNLNYHGYHLATT